MNRTRSIMLRRNHKARIAQDPTDLSIIRKSKVSDGAGGFRLVADVLGPQRVRIVRARQLDLTRVETSQASVNTEDWILMGMPGLDVQAHDEFTYRGDQWEVIRPLEDSLERVMWKVMNRGLADNG